MSAGSNGICFAASAIASAWVCTYVTPIAKNPTVDIARPPMVASPFSKFGISPSFPPSISSTRPAAANTSMIAMNMFISRTSQLFPISLFLYFSISLFLCFHLFSLYQVHFSVKHHSFFTSPAAVSARPQWSASVPRRNASQSVQTEAVPSVSNC